MTTTIATLIAKNKEKIAVKLSQFPVIAAIVTIRWKPGAVRISELCSVAVAPIAEITKKPAFRCVLSRLH